MDSAQLEAYCEAVERLAAQGIENKQAAQVLKLCGGDIDAAELWAGGCSSVGLFSLLTVAEDDKSESLTWEGAGGHIQIADSLQEIIQTI